MKYTYLITSDRVLYGHLNRDDERNATLHSDNVYEAGDTLELDGIKWHVMSVVKGVHKTSTGTHNIERVKVDLQELQNMINVLKSKVKSDDNHVYVFGNKGCYIVQSHMIALTKADGDMKIWYIDGDAEAEL